MNKSSLIIYNSYPSLVYMFTYRQMKDTFRCKYCFIIILNKWNIEWNHKSTMVYTYCGSYNTCVFTLHEIIFHENARYYIFFILCMLHYKYFLYTYLIFSNWQRLNEHITRITLFYINKRRFQAISLTSWNCLTGS